MPASPADADFWDTRYRAGRTPWDAGSVPAALDRYLVRFPGRGERVLIPGCGSGYEIEAFARAGYKVTALDFSRAAVEKARARLPAELAERVNEGDFFTHPFGEGTFDIVFERTFLCALPPTRWVAIASRAAGLLRPGGRLVGVYFFGPKEDGPPFGLEAGETERVFGEWFAQVQELPIPPGESLPLFAGRERWQEWARKG